MIGLYPDTVNEFISIRIFNAFLMMRSVYNVMSSYLNNDEMNDNCPLSSECD